MIPAKTKTTTETTMVNHSWDIHELVALHQYLTTTPKSDRRARAAAGHVHDVLCRIAEDIGTSLKMAKSQETTSIRDLEFK